MDFSPSRNHSKVILAKQRTNLGTTQVKHSYLYIILNMSTFLFTEIKNVQKQVCLSLINLVDWLRNAKSDDYWLRNEKLDIYWLRRMMLDVVSMSIGKRVSGSRITSPSKLLIQNILEMCSTW